MSVSRKITFGFWLSVVLMLIVTYAMEPEWRTPERILSLLRASGRGVMIAYLLLSVMRPFTLLPNTVLIVVGTLLFPEQPLFVGLSSLVGACASAALVYYFFDYLDLAELFQRKHFERIKWLKKQIRLKGFWMVLGWSVFQFAPSDLIYYVAGTLRMRLLAFLSAVLIGKVPLVIFYVLIGSRLFKG